MSRRSKARTCPRSAKSRSQPFAVGLVVAVPSTQGLVAGVGKKKLQRRRFNVAVANPNGIEAFSPALADEIGLHRVIGKQREGIQPRWG